MFDAVLKRSNVPRRRFGTGAILAVLLHAAGLSALLWTSTRPELKREDKVVAVKFLAPPPPVPPPPPPPPTRTTGVRERKIVRKPETIVHPKETPTEKPPEVEREQAPEVGLAGGVEGGVPGGEIGGVLGGVERGTPASAIAAEPPRRIEIDESEVKLQKISGPTPQYSEKALERGIEGTMVVRCVVTTEGAVNSCRVLKSLPYMDNAAIDALQKWRFKPYALDGRPVEVNYTFRLKLSLG